MLSRYSQRLPSLPKEYTESEHGYIIGSDEVGYGALAGPLVVAACAVPRGWSLEGLQDSKKYTSEDARKKVAEAIHEDPEVFTCIQWLSPAEASLAPGQALAQGHKQALNGCLVQVEGTCLLVVDGNIELSLFAPYLKVPKADQLVPAVSAASVIAKVARDEAMRRLHETYPVYGFDKHKGYGTKAHYAALMEHGQCPEHRESYLRSFKAALTEESGK